MTVNHYLKIYLFKRYRHHDIGTVIKHASMTKNPFGNESVDLYFGYNSHILVHQITHTPLQFHEVIQQLRTVAQS